MLENIKNHPYYITTVILIICKILGIINWSWWLVTLLIWWWIPPLILIGSTMIGYILLTDLVKRLRS
jgi:uncharacterized integral membrane protein